MDCKNKFIIDAFSQVTCGESGWLCPSCVKSQLAALEAERDLLRKENEDLKADLATVTEIISKASDSRKRMKETATRIAVERNQLRAKVKELEAENIDIMVKSLGDDTQSENIKLRAELAAAKKLVRWRNWPEEKPTKNGRYLREIAGLDVELLRWNTEPETYGHPGWYSFSSFRWLPIPPMEDE